MFNIIGLSVCLLIIVSCILYINKCELKDAPPAVIVGAVSTIVAVVACIQIYIDDTRVISSETKLAESINTFDAIACKAPDWPEFITNDVKFLNKPIQIRKTEYGNVLGHVRKTAYYIEIVPVENP
jgi:hypothetical protein